MVETLKLNPKRSHRNGKPRGKANAVFLPVDVRGDAVDSPESLSRPRDDHIEITLVNGLRITLSGDFDPGAVAQLSMLLEGIDWRMPRRTWRPSVAG